MMPPKTIGILGGMRPEATVLMMQRIIELTDAQSDQDHIPQLVDNNTQVPSRIDHLIHGTGSDPAPVLNRMPRQLEAMGAEALVMPCNTAHRYAPSIAEGCTIPLIHMVEAVSDEIADAVGTGSNVGILASPAVRMTRLFEDPLRRRGLHAVYPDDDLPLLRLIERIKAQGPDKDATVKLGEVASQMQSGGVDCLVTACTEFSLLVSSLELPLPVFDSLDAVCRSVISYGPPDTRVRKQVTEEFPGNSTNRRAKHFLRKTLCHECDSNPEAPHEFSNSRSN